MGSVQIVQPNTTVMVVVTMAVFHVGIVVFLGLIINGDKGWMNKRRMIGQRNRRPVLA